MGLSDHSLGIQAPIAAVSLGAKIIEKHLTLDKKTKGPDHKASLNPNELTMVKNIRIIEKMLVVARRESYEVRKKNIKIVRKSLVALKKINRNEKFSKFNITCKRPGVGLKPKYQKIMGKNRKRNFKEDDLIKI